MGKKLFDYVIGNPPYNEDFENSGDNGNFAKPVYNYFMDATYEVAEKVELIHPARFLFNAGSTPKAWNEKMLNDPHFKVLHYEEDAGKVFDNTEIKGGVAISYYDNATKYEPISVFTKFEELNGIMHKAAPHDMSKSMATIIFNQNRFDLDALYKMHPECKNLIGSNGRDKRFRNNIFDKLSIFHSERESGSDIPVYGVVKNKRTWKYIDSSFIEKEHENLSRWKILISSASGKGELGESIGPTVILKPFEAYTQTFLGVGAFDSEEEAKGIEKYLKTKFCRTLLGVLKITQHVTPECYKFVPLQDFTENSDIDWSKSIHEIDLQLYRKYGLDEKEIAFIESHVKEMA
jgi:hypothetical protein